MRAFQRQAPNQCAHNPFGTGGPAETLYTGVVTVASAGLSVQVVVASTPLRWGVWFVSDSENAAASKEVFFIGTTDQKPNYTSGGTPISTGVQCEFNNPLFIEIDDLSDIWIATDTSGLKISYLAA